MVVAFRNETFEIPTATPADMVAGTSNERVVTPALLGSASLLPASAFATAAQGAKADTALQPGSVDTLVVDIRSFGAIGDGVTDDTAAFVAAGATKSIVLIPHTPGGYKVNGTIPVHCRFLGVGMPTIHLTVNGGLADGDKGFWLQSHSGMQGIRIERGVTAGGLSGEYNNAVVIGEFSTDGTEYKNIKLKDMQLVGVNAGFGRTSIGGVYGNTHDVEIENIEISGFVSFGFMNHWGSNSNINDPQGDVGTMSWHPRRIRYKNIWHHSPMPDAGAGTLYFSAAHDVTVEDVVAQGIDTPITVTPGDIGALIAQGESVGHVFQNFVFTNISISNFKDNGVLLAGNSGKRYQETAWEAINHEPSVIFNGLRIARGAQSAARRCLNMRLMSGVKVNGLEVFHENGVLDEDLTSAVYIQSCDGVKISGQTKVPFPYEILGSANVQIDSNDVCLNTAYLTNTIAVRVIGGEETLTLADPVTIGDTQIVVTAMGNDLIKNSVITIGSQKHRVTRAVQLDIGREVTIPITPALVGISAGATVTAERHVSGIDIQGLAEGFWTAVRVINTNSGNGESVRIRKTFRRNGQYDINLQAAKNILIEGSHFYEGGQLNNGTGLNIRVTDACKGLVIRDNFFEDNVNDATLVEENIYLFGDTAAAAVYGNRFYNAQNAAINYFSPADAARHPDFGANYFGHLLPAKFNGTGSRFMLNIGPLRVGFASSIPPGTFGEVGDIMFDIAAPAGGKVGWKKTGASTWKPFGSIDA